MLLLVTRAEAKRSAMNPCGRLCRNSNKAPFIAQMRRRPIRRLYEMQAPQSQMHAKPARRRAGGGRVTKSPGHHSPFLCGHITRTGSAAV